MNTENEYEAMARADLFKEADNVVATNYPEVLVVRGGFEGDGHAVRGTRALVAAEAQVKGDPKAMVEYDLDESFDCMDVFLLYFNGEQVDRGGRW